MYLVGFALLFIALEVESPILWAGAVGLIFTPIILVIFEETFR